MTLNRTALAGLFAGAIALQSAWVVYTQTAKPPGPLRIEKVKGDLKVTIRCIPTAETGEPGRCIFTGEPSRQRVIWAKSY